MLGGERLGVGELLRPASRCDVLDVADGGDADVGDLGERLHQGAAAAAGADAADVERLVGAEALTARDAEGGQAGGGGGGGLEEGAPGDGCETSSWRCSLVGAQVQGKPAGGVVQRIFPRIRFERGGIRPYAEESCRAQPMRGSRWRLSGLSLRARWADLATPGGGLETKTRRPKPNRE